MKEITNKTKKLNVVVDYYGKAMFQNLTEGVSTTTQKPEENKDDLPDQEEEVENKEEEED